MNTEKKSKIREKVESYMDFKVRDILDDVTGECDDTIMESLDGSIEEDEFYECVDNGEKGELPEDEIKALVTKLTDAYMKMFD